MSRHIESTLFIHDEQVESIFEILGSDENDLSYSLGYVLSRSQRLLKAIISSIYSKVRFTRAVIKLQESGRDKGYTDIEITLDNEYLFVVEAKKGWVLPSTEQIKRYLPRFRKFRRSKRMFIVLSDCDHNYCRSQLPSSFYNVPIRGLAWREIIDLIEDVYSQAANKEKELLLQLQQYLEKVVIMENQDSNWVYVVSLADSTPSWSDVSWKDIVYTKEFYFYEQGYGPKIPPNYIAFRFDGQLQSIHHVDKYEVVQDVHKYIPEIKRNKIRNHYLLWLGPRFEPRKELPNGNIWSNGRLWCMLDTLFTSKTIKAACEDSNKRSAS